MNINIKKTFKKYYRTSKIFTDKLYIKNKKYENTFRLLLVLKTR